MIFDYYEALKEERYLDAYRLKIGEPESPEDVNRFAERSAEEHELLPTRISIGEERRRQGGDRCDYVYTVYGAHPNTSALMSGMVSIRSQRGNPEICLIGYNSAFGSDI